MSVENWGYKYDGYGYWGSFGVVWGFRCEWFWDVLVLVFFYYFMCVEV